MGEPKDRRELLVCGCACGGLLAAASAGLSAEPTKEPEKPANDGLVGPVNGDQVMAVLGSIDRSGDAELIDAVFSRWGYHCFHSRPSLVAFANRQRGHLQEYVDYVNSGRARFWERLDLDEAQGTLKVTGKKAGRCACPFAQCETPAKALCTHCCKALQRELFRIVTGRDVEVRIDEAVLLGGERCSTTIRLLPA